MNQLSAAPDDPIRLGSSVIRHEMSPVRLFDLDPNMKQRGSSMQKAEQWATFATVTEVLTRGMQKKSIVPTACQKSWYEPGKSEKIFAQCINGVAMHARFRVLAIISAQMKDFGDMQ